MDDTYHNTGSLLMLYDENYDRILHSADFDSVRMTHEEIME